MYTYIYIYICTYYIRYIRARRVSSARPYAGRLRGRLRAPRRSVPGPPAMKIATTVVVTIAMVIVTRVIILVSIMITIIMIIMIVRIIMLIIAGASEGRRRESG